MVVGSGLQWADQETESTLIHFRVAIEFNSYATGVDRYCMQINSINLQHLRVGMTRSVDL